MTINRKQADFVQYVIECAMSTLTPTEVRTARKLMAELRKQSINGDRPAAYLVQNTDMVLQHGIDHFELKLPKDVREKYAVQIPLFKGD